MAINAKVICALKEAKVFPWTVRVLNERWADKGRVSVEDNHNIIINPVIRAEDLEVGEFLDVLSVATGTKPMAMTIHDMAYWRRLRKKLHKDMSKLKISMRNKAEAIAYDNGVRCLYHKGARGYNAFYFRESDENAMENALKLAAIITNNPKVLDTFSTNAECSFCIGKLLGYSSENIRYFISTRDNLEISDEFVAQTEKKLNTMKITLDDFEAKSISVLKKHFVIPEETRTYNKK